MRKAALPCLHDMSMTPNTGCESVARYLVNGHLVSPGTNEIALDGDVTRIEPKSMEVLIYLFAHAGQVVSRAQIQDEVWGDVIVGDDSLTNAIIKLRKVFGDDARNPQVIETIPKRGYRLIAEARQVDAGTVSLPRKRGLIAVVGVLSLVVLAALWLGQNAADLTTELPTRQDNRTRVVVAPFQNLSGDPTQDYLARGVEQTILSGLAGLTPIAAMQATAGTGKADYRLEGSVQRSGDRIRVDTRLVDAHSGIVLATQRNDRAFSDLMAVEAEIEAHIVTALALDIDLANRTSQSRGYTDSIEAYDLFLQARAALLPRDRVENARARLLYQRAIKRDPHFARAYGGLALTHAAEFRNGWTLDADGALDRALAMAETALEIQPNLPEQHWVIGYVQTQRRNLLVAEEALKNALRLDPDYADALALLGGIRTYAGRPEGTLLLLREAMQLRPDAGYLYYLLLGRAYYFLDDCNQGLINLREATNRNPASVETHAYLAGCMVRLGDVEAAEWEAEEILGINPDFTIAAFFETYPMTARSQIAALTFDLGVAGMY